jgi:putative glutamine amidotransferase
VKRIGITQRVEVHPQHGETRDALDQAWPRLLGELALLPVPLCNAMVDAEGYLDGLNLDGVILSGGNDLSALPGARQASPDRDRFEKAVLSNCEQRGLPIFGVCRGLQLLCQHHGHEIVEVEGHVATRHPVIPGPDADADWPARMEVNSFHRYGVKPLSTGSGLRVLAVDEDGWIEAVAHESLNQCAVMWHPEREDRLRPEDLALFERVFSD